VGGSDWREDFRRKLVSPEEAVKVIQSGDRVHFTTGRQPQALGLALAARKDELRGVAVYVQTPDRDLGWYDPGWEESFAITVGFGMPLVTEMMADVLCQRSSRRPSLILPNDGYIENISRDAVVEVPGLVGGGRVCGVPVGPLPGPIASILQNEVEIQKLVVDAAVTGSRDLALQALLIDPVVNSARKAEALLDDILSSHAEYLPQFAS